MRVLGFLLSLSVVVLLSLASSFGLLYFLLGKSSLNLGNDRQIDLSGSVTAKLWCMLLGLGAGGFSIGPMLAPENQSVRTLFASFGGDWFLLITATLVLVGLVGGLLSKHPMGGALASGLASLILAFMGILLTSAELPNLVGDLPASQLSQLVSAVEISQLVGGGFSALIMGLMGALGGRALLYREKVPIDVVKPPKLTPLQKTTVEQVEEPDDAIAVIEPTQEALDQYPPPDTAGETYSDLGGGDVIASGQTVTTQDIVEPYGSDVSEPSGQGATGPLSRSPPCPNCGAPLSWVPEVRRYYCKACSLYP